MYAGKDSKGNWQLVKLTGPSATGSGDFEGDIVYKSWNGPFHPEWVVSHWPEVHASQEFLRPTPPPPVTTIAPLPSIYRPVLDGEPGEMVFTPRNGTTTLPPGVTHAPQIFELQGGGQYPLLWVPE